jgi:hypothetical protein
MKPNWLRDPDPSRLLFLRIQLNLSRHLTDNRWESPWDRGELIPLLLGSLAELDLSRIDWLIAYRHWQPWPWDSVSLASRTRFALTGGP